MKPGSNPPPFTCSTCGSTRVKLATDAIYVVYLRCEDCFQVWSIAKEEYLRIKREQDKGTTG